MRAHRVAASLIVALAALVALTARPAGARVVNIPAVFRVGPARTDAGTGLRVRFKDVASGCTMELCRTATDTVTVQTTTMANVNFLLNQGTTFGPFNHGGGWFETRWDTYLSIHVPGDYVFAMQVDDQASVAIGDSTILYLEGGNWFQPVRSDTVRFAEAGTYPLRAYYADCQPCCRGFRLGGMGPAGSGLIAFNAGFDFNADLGPCCTFGTNGPGLSVVPPALFHLTPPTVSVENLGPPETPGAIVACSAGPNPCRGVTMLAIELAREQHVWAEVFDAGGRRVAMLADGERLPRGVTRLPWVVGAGSARATGTYWYRVRTDGGERASGSVVVIR